MQLSKLNPDDPSPYSEHALGAAIILQRARQNRDCIDRSAHTPEVADEGDGVGQLPVPIHLLNQVVRFLRFLGRRSHGT